MKIFQFFHIHFYLLRKAACDKVPPTRSVQGCAITMYDFWSDKLGGVPWFFFCLLLPAESCFGVRLLGANHWLRTFPCQALQSPILILTFFPPRLPTCYKRPILAPRPLSPKWTSPDLLRVMPRSTYRTLSPAVHCHRFLTRPLSNLESYFLCSLTRAFHHDRTITAIPACLS
jgi:hypothetical protein